MTMTGRHSTSAYSYSYYSKLYLFYADLPNTTHLTPMHAG